MLPRLIQIMYEPWIYKTLLYVKLKNEIQIALFLYSFQPKSYHRELREQT